MLSGAYKCGMIISSCYYEGHGNLYYYGVSPFLEMLFAVKSI
jgi:hypothetical protein